MNLAINEIINIKDILALPPLSLILLKIITCSFVCYSIAAIKNIRFKEYFFGFLAFLCTLPIILTNNIFLIYGFFEILTIFSSYIIWINNARTTGFIYLMTHLFSGLLMLIGIIIYYNLTKFTDLSAFKLTTKILTHKKLYLIDLAKIFLIFAILINLSTPPFSTWLVRGYSECSTISSILLISLTTKASLFLLNVHFFGSNILLNIGLITILWGCFGSILALNTRKIINYIIISNIGFSICLTSYSDKIYQEIVAIGLVMSVIYSSILILANNLLLSLDTKKHRLVFIILTLLGLLIYTGAPYTPSSVTKILILNNFSDKAGIILLDIITVVSIVSLLKIFMIHIRGRKAIENHNCYSILPQFIALTFMLTVAFISIYKLYIFFNIDYTELSNKLKDPYVLVYIKLLSISVITFISLYPLFNWQIKSKKSKERDHSISQSIADYYKKLFSKINYLKKIIKNKLHYLFSYKICSFNDLIFLLFIILLLGSF